MNSVETYFQVLPLLSRANLVDVTYKGVTSCALA
jgi:hypothetical protein